MNKNLLAWTFRFGAAFVVLMTANWAQADNFILRGEGRDTDLMSIEKSVNPAQNLKIILTGNHPHRSESKGKFYLYTEKRQKIKDVQFALQPGETKSWEFPAEEKINLVGFGVYGKGEIAGELQQGTQIPAQVPSETGPVKKEQATSDLASKTASAGAKSGSFSLLLKEAEKSYLSGNKLETVEKLKETILTIWNEVPLSIKNVRIVEDTKTYATRKDNTFRSGEKIHINAQIFGYKLKQVGEAYSINLVTDVYFLQKGEVLTGQQNFGKFEFISPIPNTEFRMDLTYWLTDAPAGIYDIQTVVHDKNSGQSAKFSTQIEMK
jgi:hypothetical protein